VLLFTENPSLSYALYNLVNTTYRTRSDAPMYTIPLQDEFMTDKEADVGRSMLAGENVVKGEEDIEGGEDYNDGEGITFVQTKRETRLVRRDGGADGVVLSLTSKGDGFYDV
jgi:hypothetical protein